MGGMIRRIRSLALRAVLGTTLAVLCLTPGIVGAEGADGSEEESESAEEASFHIGGAFRYNLLYTYYEGSVASLGTEGRNEATWDMWRIDSHGHLGPLDYSFQYRFYPTFSTHFIHHGWLGWSATNRTRLELGVTQVPFGMLPYGSHSWWFQLPYYLGLEDDYDMGIKVSHQRDGWDLTLGYFVLPEPRGTPDPAFGAYSSARYSYDVVPVPGESNLQRHQVNARVAYERNDVEVGLSGQRAEIYNQVTGNRGSQWAAAAHVDARYGPWGLKTQYIFYDYRGVEDDAENALEVVQMSAYGVGSYDVAGRAQIISAGLSYEWALAIGPVTSVQFYNDYSLMMKANDFATTQQNVLGGLITAGPLLIYTDIASGIHHPWLSSSFGGPALGAGRPVDVEEPISPQNPVDRDPGWNTRLNINIGLYF